MWTCNPLPPLAVYPYPVIIQVPMLDCPQKKNPTLYGISMLMVLPHTLTNLPCPIELHKTPDHVMYYKSVDVALMLIVYKDMMALEESECMAGYHADGFPSYYHSGLALPMTKVVSQRFKRSGSMWFALFGFLLFPFLFRFAVRRGTFHPALLRRSSFFLDRFGSSSSSSSLHSSGSSHISVCALQMPSFSEKLVPSVLRP